MLHLITDGNRSLYEREIDALHRARKTVFVDELGWGLRVRDGMEFDEYDDERAMHIVGFDAAQEVSMSVRLRPADDRCMLLDHFASHLTARLRPTNDGRTWEISRGFSRERGVQRGAMMRKAACMLAPLEVALAAGVDRLVGYTDVRMLGLYTHVGWKLNLLGDPQPYGEGDGVGYEAEVSSRVVENIRRTWDLPAPVHIEVNALESAASVHDMADRFAADDPRRRALVPPVPSDAAPRSSARVASLAKRPVRVMERRIDPPVADRGPDVARPLLMGAAADAPRRRD